MKFLRNCYLTSYVIIFGQITFFSIIKLDFPGRHGFYLFYYNAILKDRSQKTYFFLNFVEKYVRLK